MRTLADGWHPKDLDLQEDPTPTTSNTVHQNPVRHIRHRCLIHTWPFGLNQCQENPRCWVLNLQAHPVLFVHEPRDTGLPALTLLVCLPTPSEVCDVQTHGTLVYTENKDTFPRRDTAKIALRSEPGFGCAHPFNFVLSNPFYFWEQVCFPFPFALSF